MTITRNSSAFVDSTILERVAVGRQYVAAKYGFRNHWYPAFHSKDVAEGAIKTVELLGEKIIAKRIDGTVHALRDRCLHRGVPLSKKPECYTRDTITCWYHGFTYRFTDGLLTDVIGVPGSKVAGKKSLWRYPVQEVKGLVFIFVGDQQDVLPELARDVPPGFLDPGMSIHSVAREVNANWRTGAENGFDSTHIFIHRNSVLIENNSLALPLGLVPRSRQSYRLVEDPSGAKGVIDLFDPEHVDPVFEGKIGGNVVVRGHTEGTNALPHHISIWLPGVLCVHPWPDPSLTQYEWYVPIDGKRHIYFQALGKRVANDVEERAFAEEFESRWRPVALEGFNDDDIWAREATEAFYADDTGWLREQLFEPDGNIIEWRKLASRHNRGIQAPEHIL